MARNVVCKKDDISSGEMKIFHVGRAKILVTRSSEDDKFYAVQNGCPHQGADLGLGSLGGLATSPDFESFCYDERGEHVYCPWHHWGFDVKTGESHQDPSIKVKTYDVQIEGDDLVIYT